MSLLGGCVRAVVLAAVLADVLVSPGEWRPLADFVQFKAGDRFCGIGGYGLGWKGESVHEGHEKGGQHDESNHFGDLDMSAGTEREELEVLMHERSHLPVALSSTMLQCTDLPV